ncbi:hypothetical protein [Haloarcula amylovorans]|nr:hypothetical protein [Halomicroarcula amylolytica]
MATDQSDGALDGPTAEPEREAPSPPGIAHLTVIPENADRSP